VEVRLGDRRLAQVHDGKSGYLGQSSAPLYFGRGDAGTVDEIKVRWPSGQQQTVAGPLASNQVLEIAEPK
jgi:hypothetical protein